LCRAGFRSATEHAADAADEALQYPWFEIADARGDEFVAGESAHDVVIANGLA
jgi:hypothetical protein